MPVILRLPGEIDAWMGGETPDALARQHPLPGGAVQVVDGVRRRTGRLIE